MVDNVSQLLVLQVHFGMVMNVELMVVIIVQLVPTLMDILVYLSLTTVLEVQDGMDLFVLQILHNVLLEHIGLVLATNVSLFQVDVHHF